MLHVRISFLFGLDRSKHSLIASFARFQGVSADQQSVHCRGFRPCIFVAYWTLV